MFISLPKCHLCLAPHGGAAKSSSLEAVRSSTPRGRVSHLWPGTQGALGGKRCHGGLRLWERCCQGFLGRVRLDLGIAAASRCWTLLLGLTEASEALHFPPTFSLSVSLPPTRVGLRAGAQAGAPSPPPLRPPLPSFSLHPRPPSPAARARPRARPSPPLPSSPVPFLPLGGPPPHRPPSLPTPTGSGPLGLGPRPAPSSPRRLLPAAWRRHLGASCREAGPGPPRWRARPGTGQVWDVRLPSIGESFQPRGPGMGRALLPLLLWLFLRALGRGGEWRWGPGARASELRGRCAPAGARRAAGHVCKHLGTRHGARACSAGAPTSPLTGRPGWVVGARPGEDPQGWAPRAPRYRRGGVRAPPAAGPEVFDPEEFCRRSGLEGAENSPLDVVAWLDPGSGQ